MSEHTRGPLEFSSAGFGGKSGITVDEYFIRRPEDDVAVAADVIDPETGAPSESNARRLVACWNACQNIATDAIESGSLDLSQLQLDRMMLTQKLDGLLRALERIARPHDCGCVPCTGSCTSQEALQITVDEMRDLAKAAIARSA